MHKYRMYNSDSKVIAVSSYAGKPVRGIAKCDPRDSFSYDKGKTLAIARCNVKVAEKRSERAYQCVKEAAAELQKAKDKMSRMENYLYDAEQALDMAGQELEAIENELK